MRQLSPSRVSFAAFLDHKSVVYAEGNDLKVVDDVTPAAPFPFKPRAVTTDGSSTVFNGIPDWLYEEEILSTDRAVRDCCRAVCQMWSQDHGRASGFLFDWERRHLLLSPLRQLRRQHFPIPCVPFTAVRHDRRYTVPEGGALLISAHIPLEAACGSH